MSKQKQAADKNLQQNQPSVQTHDDSEELENLKNRLKRALADYQNLEKRIALEKDSFIKFANTSLIASLIPSLEILDKAAFHSQDPGVKMAFDQFRQALLNEGLEEINPNPNDPFDHTMHECIETVSEGIDNTIAQVLSKGFRFKAGPILKPARVKVNKSESPDQKPN